MIHFSFANLLDYDTGRPINHNYYSYYKPETIFLHKLNIFYEDVKTLKKKLVSKIINDKYVMNNKDAINLYKMLGFTCIAMNESETNNKLLRTRNEILEAKCINYDCVVKERNELKSELDKVIINLCLALDRNVKDKKDVTNAINICIALQAKQNNNQYVIMENDNLKYAFNKQLMDIRVETLNNYDEILNIVDRLKEELIIKDLKLSQVMDDMRSIKAENEEKNVILQLLQEKYSEITNEFVDNNMGGILDYSQNNNELYEGKLLIVEHINHLEESNVVEVESHRLPILFDILLKMYSSKEYHLETINRHNEDQNQQLLKEIGEHKEWQKYLENENGNLYSELKKYKDVQKMLMDKVSEYNNLKEDYSKMQCMYDDELCKTDAVSKLLVDKYKQQLTEMEIKCVDKDNLIKTLKYNLTEQTNKFEQTSSMYNDEREKCLRIERYMKQMTEECTDLVHKKNIKIASIEDKCVTLKDHFGSCKAEVGNLKHNITTLKCALNKKNKILQETLNKLNEMQAHTAQTTFIEQQNLNGIKEKETILLEHRKEIECLKQKHDLNITHLTSMYYCV